MLLFQWAAESQTEANQYQQAEDGKTELSLVHFTVGGPVEQKVFWEMARVWVND